MTHDQEEQLCELLDNKQKALLTAIDQQLSTCCDLLDRAARDARLHNTQDTVVDLSYLYAVLHQHCFEQLHQGDPEIARIVAHNQSALAEELNK